MKGNKAAANQSPCLKLYEEFDSKGTSTRQHFGLCTDFMMMQSRKPSNSDLYGAFDVNLFSIPLLLSHLKEVQSRTFRGEFAFQHELSRRILVFGGSMRPEP